MQKIRMFITITFILLLNQIQCELFKEPILNQYETDNISYWKSLSPFKPSLGVSYGRIELRKDIEMKFKLICHSVKHNHPRNDFENIFRIGKNGLNYGCNYHGSRYPALYIDTKLMKFEFAISDNDFCWRQYPFKSPCEHCLSVELDSVYHFYLNFNESHVNIMYDQYNSKNNMEILKQNEIIYEGDRKGSSNYNHLCQYQDVIISDPLNVAADVTIWDIEIKSFDTDLYCKAVDRYRKMHQEL